MKKEKRMKKWMIIMVGMLAVILSTISVWARSLGIINSDSVEAQNIIIGVPNQPLGGFVVSVSETPSTIHSLDFDVAPKTAIPQITNISIYDSSGSIVAGPVDAREVNGRYPIIFTDLISIPVGNSEYVIKGKVGAGVTNGQTITLSLHGISFALGHQPTTQFPVILNTMTARGPTLTVRQVALASETVNPGAIGVTFAEFDLDTTESGEDVGLTYFPLYMDLASDDPRQLTHGQMFDGATPLNGGSAVLNPVSRGWMAIYFVQRLVLSKGTVKRITLKFNVSPGATGIYAIKCDDSLYAVGVASGRSAEVKVIPTESVFIRILNDTPSFNYGISSFAIRREGDRTFGHFALTNTFTDWQYMIQTTEDFVVWKNLGYPLVSDEEPLKIAVLLGTNEHAFFRAVELPPKMVDITLDPTTPEYRIMPAGSVNVSIAVFRFSVEREAVNLKSLGLRSRNPRISENVRRVSLWDGGALVGEAAFAPKSTNVFIQLQTPLTIPQTEKSLTVKVDLAGIGFFETGTAGDSITIDYDNERLESTTVVGLTTGQTGTGPLEGPHTETLGVRMFKSIPYVSKIPLPSTGLADGRMIRFKVTADLAGSIGLAKMSFGFIANTNVSVSNLNLFGYTDPDFSQPISGVGALGQFSVTKEVRVIGSAERPLTLLFFRAETQAGEKTAVEVPAGESRYLELRGPLGAGVSPIATVLLGDGVPVLVTNQLGKFSDIDTDENGGERGHSFIWSPNDYGVSSLADSDWTNGRAVPGLPSNGISQVRAN